MQTTAFRILTSLIEVPTREVAPDAGELDMGRHHPAHAGIMGHHPHRNPRMRHWIIRLFVLLMLVLLLALLAAWGLLRASLPQLDGEITLPGLSAPVSIRRDARGVVTIDAQHQHDAMRTLGYVHAQERYFEMDLMRRLSAGELAALIGPAALETDRRQRRHRMRARVEAELDAALGAQRGQVEAYVEGVNAGLAALRVRPWPYLLLRQTPEPWTAEDALLTGYAMYFDLQDSQNKNELALWQLRPHLPAALYALLVHDGSRWDAPMRGEPRGDAVLPGPMDVDMRTLPSSPSPQSAGTAAADHLPGSNNFAVSGALTADGRAIVANDMHLSLRAPNIWFRARLRYPDAKAPGGQVEVQGFTLPGLPAVIVGSNGQVAWGFTNSFLDAADWRLEAGDTSTLRTSSEHIAIARNAPETLLVRESDWGPVLHELADGRVLTLRWLAHLPGSLNLELAELARARDLAHALDIADRIAIPTQNLMIVDHRGQAAWRLLGPIPQRAPGCPPSGEVIAAGMDCPPWLLTSANSPLIDSSNRTRLWTANTRVIDGEDARRIGNGGYALGARAQQIQHNLYARAQFNEADLLAIQLDDHNAVLDEWWALMRTQARTGNTPALAELVAASVDWDGRARVDSTGYRIVRAWRQAVHARLHEGLLAPARPALGEQLPTRIPEQFEGVVWPLVSQQPAHLLPPPWPDWASLFESAAAEVRAELQTAGPLHARTWGEHNTAAICHPLATALPAFTRRWLCMPPDPLPGDGMMARVQSPAFGASERMVVSPGHEAEGILHMPGGQSGHLLSPFWGAGHADWVQGRPSPFLPGPDRHLLTAHP